MGFAIVLLQFDFTISLRRSWGWGSMVFDGDVLVVYTQWFNMIYIITLTIDFFCLT